MPPDFTLPPQVRPAPPADLPPAVLDPPPAIEGDRSAVPPEITLTIPGAPKPPESKPPLRRVPSPPKVTTPSAQPEQPAPPKLGPLLTPDQVRAYKHTIDECLARVQKALAVLGTKNLTAEQNDIVTRITTFRTQAEQAKEQDLLTAVSLAKRADLFAQDLLDRLR